MHTDPLFGKPIKRTRHCRTVLQIAQTSLELVRGPLAYRAFFWMTFCPKGNTERAPGDGEEQLVRNLRTCNNAA